MSHLFDFLPITLFNPLAARGAPIYAEVLLRLLNETQRHTQPLSRNLVLDVISDLLSTPEALSLTEDAIESQQERLADESLDAIQARARDILNYLKRSGWLKEEQQKDYTRTYILPSYSFRLLWVLNEIANQETLPLAGLICSIHDLLDATVEKGNAHIRLPEAHRQTLYLLNGLKELQHNIGIHIEQVLNQLNTSAVLDQLFTYRHEIVDKAYHQLRTTDHVSRFRPAVLESLNSLEHSDELTQAALRMQKSAALNKIASRPSLNEQEAPYLAEERGPDEQTLAVEHATRQLLTQMNEIRHRFESLDSLLQAIDTRHSQFVDSAVRTVELYLGANTTTSGQLHAILTHLVTEENTLASEPLPESYDSLVNLFQLSLLDADSLAPASRAPARFVPDPPEEIELTEEEIQAAYKRTLHHLTRAISRDKVRHFAETRLNKQANMRGAELSFSGPDELPLLIYLRAYGDGSLGYIVEDKEEGKWVKRDDIGYRDFLLSKSDKEETALTPPAPLDWRSPEASQ